MVKVGDEEVVNASEAGRMIWYVSTAGEYTISYTVGDDVLSAVYQVMAAVDLGTVFVVEGAADLKE